MKKILLPCLCLLLTTGIDAQSGISLTAGAALVIRPNTTFYVDGLVLEPAADFTMSGANSLVRNTTPAHTAINPSINRVFTWNTSTASFTGSITINYTDAERNGIAENELTLNIHDGSMWLPYNTGVVRDGINNHVTTAGLSNLPLNEVTLAAALAPLPWQWGRVQAWRDNDKAFVEWDTWQEDGVLHFHVQSSTDGVHWGQEGAPVVPLSGSGINRYKVADNSIGSNQMFYRIRQTDKDGRFTYSPVAAVPAHGKIRPVVFYPNPASRFITMESPVSSGIEICLIYNAMGKLVRKAQPGKKVVVDVAGLPAGVYYVRLKMNGGTENATSFVKE